ncbi:unnamed protein product [Cuscuta epithymum]|uniref:Uncharacterized protein n=1 Tax=Cuscuta epithymum TaxID=186058 RepID=A0AAV0C8C0_9ASTE|nr:unnamed protein product [Cuscuta epithymum]
METEVIGESKLVDSGDVDVDMVRIFRINKAITSRIFHRHNPVMLTALRGQFQSGNSGFPYVDNSYQSHPLPVVCQICFSPGHSALTCSRFLAMSTPALADIPSRETNSSVWYPDSGASAHMTPHEGQSDGGASTSGFQ